MTEENMSKKFAENLSKFAGDLYDVVVKNKPNENIIFSPHSIQTCGAMVRLGATGETAKELDNGLVLTEKDPKQLAQSYQTVLSKFENSSVLKIANKIFIMKNYEINSNYNELLSKNFYTKVEEVNFADSKKASVTINDWVASKTNNLIKDIIDPAAIDGLTRLIILNAIYFKDAWAYPFQEHRTREETFYLNDVDTVKVPMMRLDEDLLYGELPNLDAKVLELPYKSRNLSMFIILPNQRTGLRNLETKLKGIAWSSILESMRTQKVEVKLPRFKAEFSIELTEPLKELGMTRMFSKDAEFPNMLKSNETIQVSQVIHKAFIEVNEEGTVAAAATGYVCDSISREPEYFHANHPFYYEILTSTGAKIFAGRLVNLKEKRKYFKLRTKH